MRGSRRDCILAGTALAIVLAAGSMADAASNKVPVLARDPIPAPTAAATAAADFEAPPEATEPAKTESVPAPAASSPAAATPAAATPAATAPAVTAPAPDATTAASPPATPVSAPPTAPAAETAVPPDPLASLDPADRPIAEKIRDLLAAKADKIFATKREHAAVETFYQNRNLAPLWIEKGALNDRAKAAIARIRAADADGLDVSDYKIPDFAAASAPEALAEDELKLTETVLTYARHVQAGRFSYASVSKNIELPQQAPEPADVLTKVADAKDAAKALDEFSPPQKAYRALKAKLAELRAKLGPAGSEIHDGPELKLTKPMMDDPRVSQLREKLGLKGEPGNLHYDSELADAVRKFQRNNDLRVNGNLDAPTLRALNGPPRDRQIDIIVANMERWRWFPRDLGKTHVTVNLPDFSLRLIHNDQLMWTTRIVIGKPAMPTPLLTETMKYITVNPTWNVPQSIIQNEYLPAYREDPTVLERSGLKMATERDGTVRIWQPPGDGNALGRLRFNFPNRFDVYQHDTPDKYLFKEEKRAYSHGCMRVQDPVKYAQLLLSIERPNDGYSEERIKRMFGPEEQDITFPAPIPVHLTYQTAFVDDDGHLQFRGDVYGLDSRVLALIKTERGMIDVASKERDRDVANAATAAARKPAKQPVVQSSGGGLFGSFFGGPTVPPAPIGRQTQQSRIR
ncbi:MAG TPA: L,D-transpeptidase family protein [Xanthobacteraceae bacterium]|nr:L,D-transpeptidase family protein [Xanthobacteraceae bacterium]